MLIQLYLLLILQILSCFAIEAKPKLTFDDFFDYTTFPFLKFSPTGQHLLIQTRHPSWNASAYENTLWLYDIQNQTKKLITTNLHQSIKPQWSPSAFTWSNNDSSVYIAVIDLWSIDKENELYKDEWKDVIQYRQHVVRSNSTIYRIDLNLNNLSLPVERNIVRNVSFLINQLLYVFYEEQLIVSSMSKLVENLNEFELYSIDLRNTSKLLKLTNNEAIEIELQLSIDGHHLLFLTFSLSSNKGKFNDTQYRLYSLNLMNEQLTRLGETFHGSINGYTIKHDSGVYILGQLGTEVQIYTEQSSTKDLIHHHGWNGTYESIVSSNKNGSIAFVYSSFEKPMEVYSINNIDQLKLAQAITNENDLFTRRNLPQTNYTIG
ncbi:unnamed protein product [Rotaria sp. Silwood1]|nr:unnamed protein product [Rotaria sp. Silwood1]CAF4738348.1 unnamed protein product [Rotaria sp. Silwood1]CAF4851624.1 unnamed protein product [Rotaria sp. Silwood1]